MAHRKKDKNCRLRRAAFIAIAAALLVVLIAAVMHESRPVQASLPYLTVGEVNGAMQNASYVQIRTSLIANFSSVLESEGYLSAAVSVFNLTSAASNETPSIITSSLFLMSSPQTASSILKSLVFSNNANQSISGFVYNGTFTSNKTYNKIKVDFYTISSVAVYNTSIVNYTINSHKNFTMPVFQSTTLFSYGDYIGTVVVNGYVYSNMLQNDSIGLAEVLVDKLASSN